VRVSYNNIRASAIAIGQYLEISKDRVFIASLPLHYTYGLSLLHVAMGYRIPLVLSEHSTLTADFWADFLQHKATDFSGVPFQYEMILRSGMPAGVFEQMKCMTQAGGRLEPEKTNRLLEFAETFGFLYFTMYGQTEATPRISYVPPDFAASKLGSVGIPIPGGSLSIERNENTEEFGEVLYSGPNVCLGYASSARDLGLPDEFCGVLRTGDLGYLDEDGYLFITGRAARDIKVSGKRVSLDALEQSLSVLGGEHAVLGVDERVLVVSVGVDERDVRRTIQSSSSLHPSKISIVIVPDLPRLSSGKVDYQGLKREFLGS
jgi:acyl-CoA synthetase (AMP-forming)/AMP-acid ligase II